MQRRLSGPTVLLIAACMTLSSCASSPGQADGTSTSLDEFVGFDVLAIDEELDPAAISQAEEAVSTCMRSVGFEYTPTALAAGDSYTAPDFSSRSYVAEFGFGVTTTYFAATELPGGLSGWTALTTEGADLNGEYRDSLNPNEQAAYDDALDGSPPSSGQDGAGQPGCLATAYAGAARQQVFFSEFGTDIAELRERVASDPRLIAAGNEATRCLADTGSDFESLDEATSFLQDELRPLDAIGAANFGQDHLDRLANLQEIERTYALAVFDCGGLLGGDSGRLYFEIAAEYEQEFLKNNRQALVDLGLQQQQG